MKPWMKRHQRQEAEKSAGSPASDPPTAAAETAAQGAPVVAAPPAPPTPRIVNLPTVGRLVYVYGLEPTGVPCPMIVSDVNAAANTINGSVTRRNGNVSGYTHVAFPDPSPDVPGPAIYAAWMPYQLKAETTTPEAQAAAQAAVTAANQASA